MDQPTSNRKVWDVPVRLFHWSIVVLILLLWVTGEFGGLDISTSLPVVGDIYYSNMDIHALAGQSMFVLVVFRVLWGFWGSTTARFSHFITHPSTVISEAFDLIRGRVNHSTGHNALGGIMVVALLLLLAAQSVTGMFSADDFFFEGPLSHLASDERVEQLTGLHHLLFSFLQGFIVLHILAIFYYLLRGKNLVGAMITGNKKLHQPPQVQQDQHLHPILRFSPWWLSLGSFLVSLGLLLFLRSL